MTTLNCYQGEESACSYMTFYNAIKSDCITTVFVRNFISNVK